MVITDRKDNSGKGNTQCLHRQPQQNYSQGFDLMNGAGGPVTQALDAGKELALGFMRFLEKRGVKRNK